MAYFDFSLDQLQAYKPDRHEPEDFDAFWQNTLTSARAHDLAPKFEAVDFGFRNIDVFDVTFNGYGGQPIKGWLMLPKQRTGRLPCVVEYIGYGGGRGFPNQWLLWSAAGYAHLVMDTRGQGSTWSKGDTGDPEPEGTNPHFPGFMTRGILNRDTYYYRRVYTDGVRAVEAAQSHEAIDPDRIAVTGGSQGGGISIAVAGLNSQVKVAMPDVPFLCHYRRATTLTDANPYLEIQKFLVTHRDKVDQVYDTLGYFDGMNFASRAGSKTLFSTGLMDEVCPPSTVFAAYNHWKGEKDIRVYQFNHHEGGGEFQAMAKLKFLRGIW